MSKIRFPEPAGPPFNSRGSRDFTNMPTRMRITHASYFSVKPQVFCNMP